MGFRRGGIADTDLRRMDSPLEVLDTHGCFAAAQKEVRNLRELIAGDVHTTELLAQAAYERIVLVSGQLSGVAIAA